MALERSLTGAGTPQIINEFPPLFENGIELVYDAPGGLEFI